MRSSSLRFSVVINTLNRASHLRVALQSLQYLRHDSYEVIVVNGPSKDDTEAVMAEYADRIRIGRLDEANLSKSRNIGIAMARGEIVCFLDDDATPEPDWLNALGAVYERDAKIGAVGGYIRDHSGVNFQAKVLVCDRYGDSEAFESFDDASHIDNTPGSWQYFSQTGCNSSFRRDALLEVGGFDEEFAYFLDETDVNLRIRDAGWTITIAPDAEVHHKYAPSHLRDHKRVPSRLYLPLRSKAYFAVRHALGHKSLAEIFRKLSAHATEIHGFNRWYYDHGEIDAEHYDQLTEDVNTGLVDGVRDAFSGPANLLPDPVLAEHSAEEFKRFPALQPEGGRLRICYLSQDYPPAAAGGIGVWTAGMAREMARRGHEVSVITRSTSGQHTVDFENGIWVHRIVPSWQPDRTTPPLGDLPQVLKDYAYAAHDEVVRIHLRRGLDLVSAPIWDLEGVASAASSLLPTITSLHTTFELALPFKPDWASGDYRTNHVNKVISGEHRLLESAPYLMANSDVLVNDLTALLPNAGIADRAEVIPHGMDDATPPQSSTGTTDDELLNLLFVGRLEPRKGADLLLEIAPDLLAAHPHLHMDLMGDDSVEVDGTTLRARFEKEHAGADWLDRITFHGFVEEATRDKAYWECDLFVAPSRYESFGLIFLEAMRAGKASVGAAVGGIQEVITDQQTGLLPEAGNAEALKAALERLIKDPDLRSRLGQAARQDFEARFNLARVVDRAEAYYRKVVHAHTLRQQGATNAASQTG